MNVRAALSVLPFLVLPFVAACAGGSTAVPVVSQGVGNVPRTSLDDVRTVAEPSVTESIPQYVSSPADRLYIANANNSITVYHHDATGDAAPIAVIAGSRTGIDHPGQLAEDSQGNLYVANGSYGVSSASPAVLVFAHGANGNVAPIRRLAGSATGIHNIAAMTVDQTTGKIYVVDYRFQTNGYLVDTQLIRFGPNATGNTAPYARSAPGISPALQITSDSTGKNLIEAHATSEPSNLGLGIDTLQKQFGNAATAYSSPSYSILAFRALGVADDPTTKTYLTTTADGIYRLAETTTGSGSEEGYPTELSPGAKSVVTTDTCGTQLALGYLRNIYVVHSTASGCPADAVYVYRHDAMGTAVPLRIIRGSATQLSAPTGIFEGK